MGVITENELKAQIKSRNLERVYFLFGEEDFLVRTYAERIVNAAVPPDARDMNYARYERAPKAEELSDFLGNIPFLSDYRCVLIEDIDVMEESEFKAYSSVIENLPETAVLVIAQTNVRFDAKKGDTKPKKSEQKGKKNESKAKRLRTVCEKAGVSCEFKQLSPAAICAIAEKKIERLGCSIDRQTTLRLVEECGRSLTVLQIETDKLCSYKQFSDNKEITVSDIEKLVPKRVETSIFTLAGEIFAGRTGKALTILDELIMQKNKPSSVFAVFSEHFVDLYRAKLSMNAGKNPPDMVKAFGYAPNRAFIAARAFGSARFLSKGYLSRCLEILYRTNLLLNSSKTDDRLLVERAITEIAALPKNL